MVFDIQRFALNDGPGIRTTVFLKGCSMRCLWCHNPESQAFRPQLSFRADRCTHCLHCIPECPTDALTAVGERLIVRHDLCTACGACVEICPENALSIIGREMTAGEVLFEVERDSDFYRSSGGGMTLSGGDPLAQPTFTSALLEGAKKLGIHTCVDTSGLASAPRIFSLVPLTDLFLFDYKATDPDLHRALTGVSNELILANLDLLYATGANIRLRCPMVPGLNDQDEHLQAIAALDDRYPDLEAIEILPYHDIGKDKSARIGCDDPMRGLAAAATDAECARWMEYLGYLGCKKAMLA